MKFDVNLTLVFGSLPLDSRAHAAAKAGFAAVEMWWPFDGPTPSDREASALLTSLADAGVQLAALNFFSGDMASGDRGLVSLPGHEARFREGVDAAIGLAQQAGGCPVFNALYGNRDDRFRPAQQDDVALENLAYASAAAARVGSTVVIEALNTAENPRYPIASARQAVAIMNDVATQTRTQLGFLLDTYHLGLMREDLTAVVREYGPRIGHVQLADVPGRHEPGTGDVDFAAVLAALGEAAYGGWIGLEYRPSGAPENSFSWLSDFRGAR